MLAESIKSMRLVHRVRERNITLVSVGHRGEVVLRQFHQKILILGRGGRWKMQEVDSFDSMQSLVVDNTI